MTHTPHSTDHRCIGEREARTASPRGRRRPLIWCALTAAVLSLHALPTSAQQKDPAPFNNSQRSAQVSNVNELVVRYIGIWNERDAKRRRELIAKTWTEDGTYLDAHRHGAGHEGIDAMIGQAQEQFPGYQLRLVSGIETHNGYVRFSWAAGGMAQAPLYLAGTDFAAISSDGRLRAVTGFVDAAPAVAK